MAASEASIAGVQRLAAENPDALYQAFDSYPWIKDRVFTVSLLYSTCIISQ